MLLAGLLCLFSIAFCSIAVTMWPMRPMNAVTFSIAVSCAVTCRCLCYSHFFSSFLGKPAQCLGSTRIGFVCRTHPLSSPSSSFFFFFSPFSYKAVCLLQHVTFVQLNVSVTEVTGPTFGCRNSSNPTYATSWCKHRPAVVILMFSFDARKQKQDTCIDLSVLRSQAYFCGSDPRLYFASSKLHNYFPPRMYYQAVLCDIFFLLLHLKCCVFV